VERLAAQARARFGAVDILVNNAGNMLFKPLVPLPGFAPAHLPEFEVATSDAEWAGVQATHVEGAVRLLRAFGPGLLDRRRGSVVNVSSLSALRPARFMVTYDAAKGALIALTRSLAREWARYDVTVNCIAPGQFPTEMTREVHETPAGRKWMENRVPMRRAGDPRDVGALVVYLASDAARFMTGQVIAIDGGEGLG
jgi:NAD(P)-dependent dehydrogenase (short-subunit alcohol dehydrogenase family)